MPNMASIVDGANHQPPLKSDIAGECRELLAAFVLELQCMPAQWYPILSEGDDGLAVLLGLDYYERYLPLMIKCGLVKCVQGRHYQVPRTSAHFSQKSYSWVAFCTQYKLTDIEVSQSYIQQYKQQLTFIRVGTFDYDPEPFTAVGQYKGGGGQKPYLCGLRCWQSQFA